MAQSMIPSAGAGLELTALAKSDARQKAIPEPTNVAPWKRPGAEATAVASCPEGTTARSFVISDDKMAWDEFVTRYPHGLVRCTGGGLVNNMPAFTTFLVTPIPSGVYFSDLIPTPTPVMRIHQDILDDPPPAMAASALITNRNQYGYGRLVHIYGEMVELYRHGGECFALLQAGIALEYKSCDLSQYWEVGDTVVAICTVGTWAQGDIAPKGYQLIHNCDTPSYIRDVQSP